MVCHPIQQQQQDHQQQERAQIPWSVSSQNDIPMPFAQSPHVSQRSRIVYAHEAHHLRALSLRAALHCRIAAEMRPGLQF